MPKHKKITAAVLEQIPTLIKAGISSGEIADRIGCTLGTVRVVCSKAKISLRKNADATIPVALPGAMIGMFQREAGTRGLTVPTFASMLEVIAQGNLYDAVLDEREPCTGGHRNSAIVVTSKQVSGNLRQERPAFLSAEEADPGGARV